jgi:hypothetical protein
MGKPLEMTNIRQQCYNFHTLLFQFRILYFGDTGLFDDYIFYGQKRLVKMPRLFNSILAVTHG